MGTTTYPFPLAAQSSHHSHYHRFLLGADASVLSPFPKPYCVGAMSAQLGSLTSSLDLARWRKLFYASIPWVEGFGRAHYEVSNVPPHRPLPAPYARPPRRFAAFDFVQIADPSYTALALVAGDRRLLRGFLGLADAFCGRIEAGVCSSASGSGQSSLTGRMLAGQFAEPNNRWLMPLLHVHSRVLNFTSPADTPLRMTCIDQGSLAAVALGERRQWLARQAQALTELGYRADVREGTAPSLSVRGVTRQLLASMDAPRIAVLRILERVILGDGPSCPGRLQAEFPASVIAAMAEQVESLLARSLSLFKPAKVALPSEGPWRAAVREHLNSRCADSVAALDQAAARARAEPLGWGLFHTPPLDPAHCHAPSLESLRAPGQNPADADLGSIGPAAETAPASQWLADEFDQTLREVNERIVHGRADDPVVALRDVVLAMDQLCEAAHPAQLEQARTLICVELERHSPCPWDAAPSRPGRGPLVSLEELFSGATHQRAACERELGGRSL